MKISVVAVGLKIPKWADEHAKTICIAFRRIGRSN